MTGLSNIVTNPYLLLLSCHLLSGLLFSKPKDGGPQGSGQKRVLGLHIL